MFIIFTLGLIKFDNIDYFTLRCYSQYVSSVCTLCLKKFETEQKIRFRPEKGAKTRLDDNLFIKEYKASSKKAMRQI